MGFSYFPSAGKPLTYGGFGGFSGNIGSGSVPPFSFDFTTGVLPGAITFTRASIGTYNSSGNVLTTASANAARFNYVGGVANLLIEPTATNLLTQSNNFSNAAWTPNLCTLTAAQFVSPDGTNNGWAQAATGTNGYVLQTLAFSNVPYVISIWAKRISGTGDAQLYLNGAPFFVGLSTTLVRISGTGTIAAGSGPAGNFIVSASGNTNGIYGAQVELGSAPTSYIPTTTAAVTRAADNATFTIPAGIGHLTYTFDDNSTQLVSVSAGSYTIPTNLNRPNIKSIVGSA